jgi:hypothetical protein
VGSRQQKQKLKIVSKPERVGTRSGYLSREISKEDEGLRSQFSTPPVGHLGEADCTFCATVPLLRMVPCRHRVCGTCATPWSSRKGQTMVCGSCGIVSQQTLGDEDYKIGLDSIANFIFTE